MFWYLNGFDLNNGNLKTVPGSHLFRNDTGAGRTDDDIMEWARDKVHPATGEPLAIRKLACPRGSVVVMMTHATHGVGAPVLPALPARPTVRQLDRVSARADPKPDSSERRWALITAYRNPGAPLAHDGIAIGFPNWMTPRYKDTPTPGLSLAQKRWD